MPCMHLRVWLPFRGGHRQSTRSEGDRAASQARRASKETWKSCMQPHLRGVESPQETPSAVCACIVSCAGAWQQKGGCARAGPGASARRRAAGRRSGRARSWRGAPQSPPRQAPGPAPSLQPSVFMCLEFLTTCTSWGISCDPGAHEQALPPRPDTAPLRTVVDLHVRQSRLHQSAAHIRRKTVNQESLLLCRIDFQLCMPLPPSSCPSPTRIVPP